MIEIFILIVLAVGLIAVYLIPTFFAFRMNHQSKFAIMIVNILLGWTMFGYAICLIWIGNIYKQTHKN